MLGERDYKKACRAVHAAGYATDPEYANSLIKLIERYDLTRWDNTAHELTEYVTQQDDTLWALARRFLGDGSRWPEIAELNGNLDPKTVCEGMLLKIPACGGAE